MIEIQFEKENGHVFAINDSLMIYGEGGSRHEALADFALHFEHFHDHYTSMPVDKLIGDALRLKRLYEAMP